MTINRFVCLCPLTVRMSNAFDICVVVDIPFGNWVIVLFVVIEQCVGFVECLGPPHIMYCLNSHGTLFAALLFSLCHLVRCWSFHRVCKHSTS